MINHSSTFSCMVECNFCDLGDFGSHLLLYGLGILLDKKREESKYIREHRGTTSRSVLEASELPQRRAKSLSLVHAKFPLVLELV